MTLNEWLILNKGNLAIGTLANSDYVECRMSYFFGEYEAPNFNNLYGDILKKLWDDYINRNLKRLENFYNEVYVENVLNGLNYKQQETLTGERNINGTSTNESSGTNNTTTTLGEVTKNDTTIESDVAYNSLTQKDHHKTQYNSVAPETINSNALTFASTQNNTTGSNENNTQSRVVTGINGKTMTELLIESNKQFLLNPIDDFIDSFCRYNLYFIQ